MTVRKPLVTVSGQMQQLQAADVLDPATLGTGSGGASKFLREDSTWQAVAGSAAPTFGTATLDFGAFPGASDAKVVITGQAAIVAGSTVKAWLRPVATADHTADEHLVETMAVTAGTIVAGVGFTIYGVNTSVLNEPVEVRPDRGVIGGGGTRIYGTWSVSWMWA